MRILILGVIAVLAVFAPPASAASVRSLPADASVLLALDARSGSLTPATGRGDRFTLILRGVARGTTWFSDRPRREAGRITTRSLLRSWKRLGFVAEPPNAAIVLDDERTARDTLAVELRLRGHDSRRRTARFSVRALHGLGPGLSRLNKRLDRRLPRHFAGASLFIDNVTSTSCTVGQPRLFGFSRTADGAGYVQAGGSTLSVAEYPQLFAFFGTRFGGDGQQTFDAPTLPPPLPGTSWQVCAAGATPTFRRMPECPTGELVLWALGDTPVSAVDDEFWLPADGRTVAAADYPRFAALSANVGPPSTFSLPNLPAPPGFVYLACVYGDDDPDPFGEGDDPVGEGLPYVGQLDLFPLLGYPDDRLAGQFLPTANYPVLFQLLGTTFGGNGASDFVTPAVPSPLANFAYRLASDGLYPESLEASSEGSR